MAGKVNGRKSKARVSDAIKLNGENDLETSTEEAAGDASITNIEPPIEEATPDSGTSTKSPKSTAKSPSPIKSAVRASRGSKRKEEAISASEEDSDAAQTTAASEMAAPRRGSRPKKPKLDPDMVNEKWTLKTVIKEEPQEEELPAAAKTDSTESRPQSQQSFKSEDEGSISVGSPASGKSRGKTDLSNPAYRKPMMHGWKRELVFRATVDPTGRRQGDIYYYAPNGKKLRSGRELVDYLTDDLTLDNFTFAKEPLGINDPEKEIIRDAKGIKPRLSVDSPSGGMLTPPQASNTPLGKRVRKPKLPKGASPTPTPPHVTSETTTPVRTKTPPTTTKISPKKSFKVKLTNSRLSSPTVEIAGASGVKSLPKSQNRKSLNTVGDKPSNSDLKSEKTPATKINKRSNNKNSQLLPPTQLSDNAPVAIGYKPSITPMQEQCSIQCIKAMGMIPTLQCAQCLCLYHAECAGLYQSNSSYICLNCHAKNSEAKISTEPPSTSPLPPLTPITSIKTHTPVSATPPKLQRIPKAGEKIFIPPPKIIAQNKLQPGLKTSPNQTNNVPVDINKNKKLVMVPRFVKVHQNDNATTHKSLVGSVTTWLPPSSTVQVNKAASQVEQKTSTAQDMAVIGGKKYIIVPKHNVLSVSPAQSCVEEGKNEKHDIIVEKRDITISDISQPTDTKVFDKPDIEINLIPEPVPVLKATTLSVENITSVDRNVTLAAEDESLPSSPKKKSVGKDKDVAADETSAVIAPAAVSSGPNVVQSVADGFTIAPNPFTQFFFTNISTGYYTLLQVFQYLKVQELLRASRVCRMWNELALDKSLWRTVRMKNSNIVNWTGFAKTLQKLGTKHLDLRKMLIASSEADEMWNKFSENIHMADSLTTIDICRCPARVLEQLFITNPGLTVINAVAIRDDRINIENITNLKNLQELRLKSTTGFVIEKDLSGLKELSGLKQLSITSVRDLGKIGCEVIGELTELRTLELGECTDFPESFGKDALSKLINLERLRLEKGQGNCCTFDILNTISQLPAITQLELLNFDIKAGFDKTLASCSNIRKLLIIPTYISQSATTNHMVLGGVINLSSSLTHFVWGVTLELLRVTELFVDQCEGSKKEKKPTSESIPVLKPVPGLKLEDASPGVYPSSNAEVPQVEIMPLPALQKLLTDTLPQTKIRILKIPFHSTWRQSISEFQ